MLLQAGGSHLPLEMEVRLGKWQGGGALGHQRDWGKRSTECVPIEAEVCISVVLGILGSKIFCTVNEKGLGKRWKRHPKL